MSSREEPRWLSKELMLLLHHQSLASFGGATGIRDLPLLESAIARPIQRFTYVEDVDLFELAAVYCCGIVKNHPFVDGNKRAGLLSIRTFLFLNGYAFDPDELETVQMIEGLAAGKVTEADLTHWVRSIAKKR